MRKPPDKDGHAAVSDRDVDLSNATLNTLFGGARQKSWMTTAGAPVRPTPRRSISKASGSTMQIDETTAVVPPSSTTSCEPVPGGSIPGSEEALLGTRNHTKRANAVEQDCPADAFLQTASQGDPGARSSVPQTRFPQTSQTSGDNPPAFQHGDPCPQGTTIMRQPQNPQLHRRGSRSTETQSSAAKPSDQFLAHSAPPRPTPGNVPSQSSTPVQAIELSVGTQDSRIRHPGYIGTNATSPNTGPSHPPPMPAMAQNMGQPHTRSGNLVFPSQLVRNQAPPRSFEPTTPLTASRRQITQSLVAAALAEKVALIKAHIASSGGIQNLNNSLERPRFQLLESACEMEDGFYLVLHQIFCIWDWNPSQIISFGGLPTKEILATAFSILGQLIRNNDGMATNHLRWFSQFPAPLDELLTSERYHQTLAEIGIFLNKLASDWAGLSRDCSDRLYPPLVDELADRLGLLSPILQGVVFTATRRNLGLVDEPLGQRVEAIFKEDRNSRRELIIRSFSNRPPTPSELRERNRAIANQYQALICPQHQPTVNPLGRITATRPLSKSSAESSSAHTRPAPNVDRAPFPMRNFDPSQHSPVSLNGRPPSRTNQLAYTSAPSPTFMRNLTIHSPVSLSPVEQGFQRPAVRNHQVHPQQNQSFSVNPSINHNGVVVPNQPPTLARATSTRLPAAGHQHQMFVTEQHRQQLVAGLQQQQGQQSQQNQQLQQAHAAQRFQYQAAASIALGSQVPPGMQLTNRAPTLQQQPQVPYQQQPTRLNQPAPFTGNSVAQPQSQSGNVIIPSRPSINTTPPNLPAQILALRGLLPPPDVIHHQARVYTNTQPAIHRPLVPPIGYTQPSQPVNSDLTALHQAHVRSPRLVAARASPDGESPKDDSFQRFYQYVESLILGPVIISATAAVSKFAFAVDRQHFPRIAKDKWPPTDPIAVRMFENGTLQYRLRCIPAKQGAITCDTSEWVVSETAWPETVFLQINNEPLEVRRKGHHGKDLPVDITRYILQSTTLLGGSNKISMSTPRLFKVRQERAYLLAVEAVEIIQHAKILEMCQQKRIPSSHTLDAIKKSLAGPQDGDDEDVAMVVSDLSIDLADPFTARIFTIPARGSSCLHRECFDLETFLLTRNSKPKRPGQPCMVDVWKCPLCGRDARPHSLRIDDFLADVRAKLDADGNLDTRAILIAADGSWRPKLEPLSLKRKAGALGDDEDCNDEPSDGEEPVARPKSAAGDPRQASRSVSRPVEVIELDED